ncbi:MAG TPA: DUF4386 domain-containing protein [Candidatus Xenobia bacterium]|nr:DUF4386 domain-containing protein [Candidatus Xenobia bacterium]
MTLRTNARLAGFTFLFYIATGIASMVVFNRATGAAEGAAGTLASLAQHAALVRLTAALTFLQFLSAVVLGVTLYALTRDEDSDLAILALCCRASEGVVGAVAAVRTLGLLSVATTSVAATGPDAATAVAFGDLLLKQGGSSFLIAASCFAVGSTLFSYLFLRARNIPLWMAWLGVLASVLLVVALPLRLFEFLKGPLGFAIWLPMLVFEVALALWLLFKGVTVPSRALSA